MKIHKLVIENFRAYKERTEIRFDDLTVFIGKNDVGKSSILEALDIFFENVKLDKGDRNIHSDGYVKIGVIFSNLPDDFLIDSTNQTSLKDEFLLNKDNFLEIYKEFKTKTEISINAYYPVRDDLEGLVNLKTEELKELIQKLKIPVDKIDKRKSSELRKVIKDYIIKDDTEFKEQIIILDPENKDIWKKIQKQLPLYALFKADRATSDKDKEIQDPMKLATKNILKELHVKLQEIQNEVENYVKNLADKTIEKMKDMDSQIASSINTIFEDTKWDKAFSIRLESDNVPLDKKGSGLRRLVLINFFRAEVERKMNETTASNVIYAIEEPETSQHPDWQGKLIEVFKELSERSNNQVFLTTHSAALAGMVKTDNIRYVKKLDEKVEILKREDINLEEIATTLGLLPNIPLGIDKLKLIICVEGHTDVEFYKSIFKLYGVDIDGDDRLMIIFTGGDTLTHWIDNNYLRKLGRPEFHIYDNDVPKYQKDIEKLKIRDDGSMGLLTKMKETENYIHPNIIQEHYKTDKKSISFFDIEKDNWVELWRQEDVPKLVSNILKENAFRKSSVSKVKKALCFEGSRKMTKELFIELKAEDEIKDWIKRIKHFIS